MTLLVCLCGAPQLPNLSGVRPPTEEQVTRGLLDGIAGVYEAAPARCLERLRGAWCSQVATLAQCQQLEKELDELQQRLYALFPIITGIRLFGRRRWRGASHRQADSQGRDQLVVALQRCGVPFRRAGEVVSAIVGIWTAALARGEAVELPVGRLVRRKQKIRWEPERGLFPSEKLPFLPERFVHPHPDKHITCERCGSPWFAECEFRQYAASAYSQLVGGDIRAGGSSLDPQRTQVCLCGHPRTPRPASRRDTEGSNFREALKKAQKHIATEAFLEDGFATLARIAATTADLRRLQSRMGHLEGLVTGLTEQVQQLRPKRQKRSRKQQTPEVS